MRLPIFGCSLEVWGKFFGTDMLGRFGGCFWRYVRGYVSGFVEASEDAFSSKSHVESVHEPFEKQFKLIGSKAWEGAGSRAERGTVS